MGPPNIFLAPPPVCVFLVLHPHLSKNPGSSPATISRFGHADKVSHQNTSQQFNTTNSSLRTSSLIYMSLEKGYVSGCKVTVEHTFLVEVVHSRGQLLTIFEHFRLGHFTVVKHIQKPVRDVFLKEKIPISIFTINGYHN